MAERLLTIDQVRERVPKSMRTIYRWMSQGTFPRNIQIGPNSVVWRESDIDKWLAERMATAA
ncbi:MAG TPA: AlpA family phage regulatory protein [Sphingobium sp.]|nr:AlpA family phage regulatory protein [Sphingobium sp.]